MDDINRSRDPGIAPGLAGFAVDDGPPPAPEPAAAAPPPASAIEPYSAEEVAAIVATFSAFGLPADAITAYHRAVIEQSRLGLELLGVGPALAEYGIGKGGTGIDAMPAWARLLAGAGVVGWVVVSARREHARPELADDTAPDAASVPLEGMEP